jgi:hypothetical protein
MVLVVYDEPARSFQQVLDDLPKNRYEWAVDLCS